MWTELSVRKLALVANGDSVRAIRPRGFGRSAPGAVAGCHAVSYAARAGELWHENNNDPSEGSCG